MSKNQGQVPALRPIGYMQKLIFHSPPMKLNRLYRNTCETSINARHEPIAFYTIELVVLTVVNCVTVVSKITKENLSTLIRK